MASRFYKVAEHVFSVNWPEQVGASKTQILSLQNYEPFAVAAEGFSTVSGADSSPAPAEIFPAAAAEAFSATAVVAPLFSLDVSLDKPYVDYTEETRQEEEGQEIYCGHNAEGESVFEFTLYHESVGMLICSKDYGQARLLIRSAIAEDDSPRSLHLRNFAVNNSLMVLYALATANSNTALFHAAFVGHAGQGYIFLGKSGTGKSTHARLWLSHIPGTELLNDDNPVVRVFEDGAKVYGSPWSGKTPCYKNVVAPLKGIALLNQAPYNKISPLRGVQAFAAIVPSISGKRWDSAIADGLYRTEMGIVQKVRMFYLECLPNEEAAQVCFDAMAVGEKNPQVNG